MIRIYLSAAPWEPEVWVIERPYARQTAIGLLEVPAGFRTDLASTPRTVWRMFPKFGRWFGAAVVHDFLYRTKPEGVTRLSADWVFCELMKDDGVWHGMADAMFRAVRAFGDTAWNRRGALQCPPAGDEA